MPLLRTSNAQSWCLVHSYLMNDWIYFFFFKPLNHTHLLLSLNLICLYSCGAFELCCFPLWGHVRVLIQTKSKKQTNKQTHLVPVTIELELCESVLSGYLLRKRWPHLSVTSLRFCLPQVMTASAVWDQEGAAMLKVNFRTVCHKTQSHWFLMHGLDSHFLFFNFWCSIH